MAIPRDEREEYDNLNLFNFENVNVQSLMFR